MNQVPHLVDTGKILNSLFVSFQSANCIVCFNNFISSSEVFVRNVYGQQLIDVGRSAPSAGIS